MTAQIAAPVRQTRPVMPNLQQGRCQPEPLRRLQPALEAGCAVFACGSIVGLGVVAEPLHHAVLQVLMFSRHQFPGQIVSPPVDVVSRTGEMMIDPEPR